jgi:hypothetical protein
MDQAGCLEDTPLLPQRVKSGSIPGCSPLPFGGIASSLRSSQRPLSLPYGLLNTQPDPLHTTDLRMLP